jgi:hypothetical protein
MAGFSFPLLYNGRMLKVSLNKSGQYRITKNGKSIAKGALTPAKWGRLLNDLKSVSTPRPPSLTVPAADSPAEHSACPPSDST